MVVEELNLTPSQLGEFSNVVWGAVVNHIENKKFSSYKFYLKTVEIRQRYKKIS